MQPILRDSGGVVRFKPNSIVRVLLDTGKLTLNDLLCMNFSQEEWEQFYQLIGYSVSGFGAIPALSGRVKDEADRRAAELYKHPAHPHTDPLLVELQTLPNVTLKIDASLPDKVGWVEVIRPGGVVEVIECMSRGYGLSSIRDEDPPDKGLFEKADEVYPTVEKLMERLRALIASGERTFNP